MFRIFLPILVVVILFFYGIGLLIVWRAEKVVIEPMVEAVEQGDAAAILARIDWQALQNFLRGDITDKMRSAPSDVEISIGEQQPEIIAEIVDYYVRPENIALLLDYRQKLFPAANPADFIADISWRFPLGFEVALGYPIQITSTEDNTQTRRLTSRLQSHIQVKCEFRLVGGTWKITRLHVPLFMVPRHTYERPALEHFGERL